MRSTEGEGTVWCIGLRLRFESDARAGRNEGAKEMDPYTVLCNAPILIAKSCASGLVHWHDVLSCWIISSRSTTGPNQVPRLTGRC